MKVLAFSPHFDDAIFSCGDYLAGQDEVLIVTLFAGVPSAKNVVTAFDQKVGFENAEDAVMSRRKEDAEAAAVIGAKVLHLDFPDGQYGEEVNYKSLVAAIKNQIEAFQPDVILGPVGIKHPDHISTAKAFMEVTGELTKSVYFYSELPYRILFVNDMWNALSKLDHWPTPESLPQDNLYKKLLAMHSYKSQFPGLNIHTLCVPEEYWKWN